MRFMKGFLMKNGVTSIFFTFFLHFHKTQSRSFYQLLQIARELNHSL